MRAARVERYRTLHTKEDLDGVEPPEGTQIQNLALHSLAMEVQYAYSRAVMFVSGLLPQTRRPPTR